MDGSGRLGPLVDGHVVALPEVGQLEGLDLVPRLPGWAGARGRTGRGAQKKRAPAGGAGRSQKSRGATFSFRCVELELTIN